VDVPRRVFLGGLVALAASPKRAFGRHAIGGLPADSYGPIPGLFPDPLRHWHGASSIGFAQLNSRLPALARGVAHAAAAAAGGLSQEPRRVPDRSDRSPERERTPLARIADLRRHFVFEYYPWYRANPWGHWNESGRMPPEDIAASSYPLLGPYDSRDVKVIEQHARWIADAGVGAVNLSWWGRGDFTDRTAHILMDVMRAHDIHVTFHIEPYRNDRGATLAADLLYLVREFGDRRRWDCLLLLEDAAGQSGPVFKLFATILPPQATDCLGRTFPVRHYVADAAWRQQLDTFRRELADDFDRVTVLADSLDMERVRAAGFDGTAVYDAFVRPETWPRHAAAATARGLVFSFNVNAGFDVIRPRPIPTDPCWRATPFEPGGHAFDWADGAARAEAMRLGLMRIEESFRTTVTLQTRRDLSDAERGFFLVYVNTFNEWHEGTQFEPMKSASDLTAAERRLGYHNAPAGDYRLRALQRLIAEVA
jgi:glycoprotein endo-alpha-1,2-mannosidase